MKIVIIGAGNVATHLALAIQQSEHRVVQLYSRTQKTAAALAERIPLPYTNNIDELIADADAYLYAVSDDALIALAQLPLAPDAVHIHTAGSIDMNIFRGYKTHYAVLYPLQSISKEKELDFRKLPLLVEASDERARKIVSDLAHSLSDNISYYNSGQRLKTHLAAVFVNNFVNHLFHIAADLLAADDIDFEVLKPLIKETVEKINYLSPKEAQTGPAKRNDQAVMTKHLEMLSDHPKLQQLYQDLSQLIMDEYLHQS